MPWQREIAMVGCEIDSATGGPAYREIVVTVPRQSGKTTLFLSWQINRCLSPRWAQPQRSAFTAQSGKDARDKWLDELYPLIKGSKLYRFVRQMTRGMGNEYIEWKNGSLIRLLSTSSSSGHSKTLQQAVLDEIWHDQDDRREQGLRPAMITVPDAQLLICSTAGTASSVVLNRKVALGRAAVEADLDYGTAYFEYSAPDGWDPEDEESYFGFMPALCPDPPCQCGAGDGGWRHTVTLDSLRSERVSMNNPAEYARAYGNIATPTLTNRPIDLAAFAACMVSNRARPDGVPTFFADVSPGMRSSAIGIAAADDAGLFVDEERDEGTTWLVPRAVELKADHPTAEWFCEAAGAVGSMLPEFAEAGIELKPFTGPDMGRACGHLQKLVADRAFQVCDDEALTVALAGAVKRDVGEGLWAWGRRKSSTDISPLVVVTGAAWAHIQREKQQPFFAARR